MKNKKLLVLASMALALGGLVGCGEKKPNDGGKDNPTPEACTKHDYGDWTETKAATCAEEGSKERVCKVCNEKDVQTIKKTAHNYVEDATKGKAATCAEAGEKVEVCSVCKDEKKTPIAKTDHKWSTPAAYAQTDSKVEVTKSTCSDCGVEKYVISATKYSAIDGSIKSGTLDGFVKLNKNNNKLTYNITMDGSFAGTIYQEGVMDSYSNNTDRTLYTGNSSSPAERETPNFDLRVNDVVVDSSAYKTVKISDVAGSDEDPDNAGYSKLALFATGEVNLNEGENVITYERVDSFNLLVKNFVLIGKTTNTSGCTHEWVDDTAKTDVAATCENNGTHFTKCSKCGTTKSSSVAALGHEWEADATGATVAPTCTEAGKVTEKCKRDGCTSTRLVDDATKPALGHTYDYDRTSEENAKERTVSCSVCHANSISFNAENMAEGSTASVQSSGGVKYGSKGAWTIIPADKETDELKSKEGEVIKYTFNSVADVKDAKLSMTAKYSGTQPMFSAISGDSTKGYVYDETAEGNKRVYEWRYILVVNGVEVPFTPYADANAEPKLGANFSTGEFPCTFDLKKGANTIELRCMGGYRATIKEFTVSFDGHAWVERASTLNSDSKTINTFRCSFCNESKYSMAIADCSGESALDSGNKFVKNKSMTWKFTAPAGAVATLYIDVKLGTKGQGTQKWDTWSIKAGADADNMVDGTVLVNGMTYLESGVNADTSVTTAIPFATFTTAGSETIVTLTNGGTYNYRNVMDGNISIVFDKLPD